jgi:hypothetical protein
MSYFIEKEPEKSTNIFASVDQNPRLTKKQSSTRFCLHIDFLIFYSTKLAWSDFSGGEYIKACYGIERQDRIDTKQNLTPYQVS